MGEALYHFSVETRWTIFAQYTSDVWIYSDRVEVQRSGRINSIPESVIIPFDSISAITYTKDTNYQLSYIAFPGLSGSNSQSISALEFGKITMGVSSANPWHDPYGIVFKMNMYEEGKVYYQALQETFEAYKRTHSAPAPEPVQNVIVSESAVDKLKKLKELKDLGILTDSEYEEKRLKLLAEI